MRPGIKARTNRRNGESFSGSKSLAGSKEGSTCPCVSLKHFHLRASKVTIQPQNSSEMAVPPVCLALYGERREKRDMFGVLVMAVAVLLQSGLCECGLASELVSSYQVMSFIAELSLVAVIGPSTLGRCTSQAH